MKWLAIGVALVALIPRDTGVECQCYTEKDSFHVLVQTNLSQITDFGLDLFKQFLSNSSEENAGNVFFSPYSIWSALSLAYFGAEGDTKSQLREALHTDDKMMALRTWNALDITYFMRQQLPSSYTFALANRIYVDDRLPFRNCTKVFLRNTIQHMDFRDKVAAVEKINGFVSDTTGGRIQDLLDTSAVSDALLILVNAAYFKGTWKYEFKPSLTRAADFTSGTIRKEVKMMHLTSKLKYGEDPEQGIRLLELPYEGDVISMYLLLPSSEGDSEFDDVIQSLDSSSLFSVMSKMKTENVNLRLPKFSLETTLEDELTEALQNLGIVDLFNQTTGNLTRFVDGMNLGVDKSIHKAFIEVTEEGTEAAAATAFVISTRAGMMKPRNQVDFHCNRPFVFFLFDNYISNVLFMGAYRSP